MKVYYLYILANNIQDTFYIDITDNTKDYMKESTFVKKNKPPPDLNNMKLVYFEKAGNILQAIRARKKLQKWEAIWIKILIDKCNPDWAELKNEFIEIESIKVMKYSNSAEILKNQKS